MVGDLLKVLALDALLLDLERSVGLEEPEDEENTEE